MYNDINSQSEEFSVRKWSRLSWNLRWGLFTHAER